MIRKIRKRDGKIADFNPVKITNAIWKAAQAVGGKDYKKSVELTEKVIERLERELKKGEIPTVEQVQDIVEKTLIEEGHAKTAKAYILYRKQHQDIREIGGLLKDIDVVDDYLSMMDWKVQENSNMSYSLQGLNVYATENIISHYWLNKIYPPEIGEAHTNGDYHIHDLGTLGAYCVGWDLKDVLLLGFRGVSGKIESKPAKHFSTALMQIVNYLYTLQGEAAGAQALSNFDTLLAPFIRYDGLKYNDVKQEMQKFLFNMNVPTRVGFQSLTYEEPVIFKRNGKIKIEQIGKLIEETFGENRGSIVNNIDGYGNPSKDSFAVIPNDKLEVISFNKKGEIQWHPVKALIKHKVKTNGFKKIRTGSGEIKISPAHSLFKINGNHIKPVMAKELECTRPNSTLNEKNHILSINKLKQNMLGDKNKIDLFELIEELPEKIKKRIFIQARDVPTIKEKIKTLYGSLKEFLYKNGRTDKTTLYKGFKKNIVPFETYVKYSDELRDDAKIYIKPYNEHLYERYLNGEKLKNFVKLTAWYITEGKAVHSGIVVSQRKNKSKDILNIAKAVGVKVNIEETKGYSNKNQSKTNTIISNIRMSGLYTYLLPYLAGATSKEKTVPSFVFDLNSYYRNIFLETLFQGDGYFDKKSKRINYSSMSDKLLTGVSLLSVANGWRVRVVPKNKNRAGSLLIYKNPKRKLDIMLQEVAGTPVYEIEDYKNSWEWEYDISVDVKDCEENFAGGTGLVFYHNSPFTNITLDLTVPGYMVDEPAIIGGELKDDNYSDFVDEMNMINQAFAEIMYEGDARGRPFTFPIPTYNITKDFKWDNDVLDPLWDMTARYGIPYFSNFINSDMKPDDARSMCLHPDEEVLIKNTGNIKRVRIKEFVEQHKKTDYDENGWAECDATKKLQMLSLNPETLKVEWVPVKRFLKIIDDKLVEIITEDGKFAKFSTGHIIPVLTENGIENRRAEELKEGDYLINLKSSKDSLSKEYQKIEDLVLNEDFAKILGYFTADGNYLFENRKNLKTYGMPRGLQFTFKQGDWENINLIKNLLKTVLRCKTSEKKDPRYNTYYLYIYNARLARKIYNAGFRKYGRLPQILFNSPPSVIKSFLEYHFRGDGYEKRKEIHLNDLELSRDLVLLYSLIGQPVVYRVRKNSQIIYLQHSKSPLKSNGLINNPLIYERVPGFLAKSTYVVPGLIKSRTVGLPTLEKYNAKTVLSKLIEKADVYIVRIKSILKKTLDAPQEFYDVELSKNHLFIHSLGTVTHNCCRLRLDNRELRKRGGGLFGANPKTGSIGVVTINMPRIGYLARDDDDFFERLDRLMELAKQSLIIKREVIENLTYSGLHPYSRFYLSDIKKAFGEYWKNHFSTIGLIGMNDALLNFMNKSIGDKEGKEFAEKVLDYMREKIADFQEETGDIFNLEATPAEGTSYRLARIDKAKYPDIRVYNQEFYGNGGKVEPYYTNSTQLPVGFTTDIFEALDLQDTLQSKYTGGTVLHIFLGEEKPSPSATKKLIRKVAENYTLPYYTITPTFSICPDHGYMSGKHHVCPVCKSEGKNTECEVYSRVVGYLRPVNQWNRGKQQEFHDRKTFDMMLNKKTLVRT